MNTTSIDDNLRADLRDVLFHPGYVLESLNCEAGEQRCWIASSDFGKMERMGIIII